MTDQEEPEDSSLMKILGALKKPKEPEKKAEQEKPAGFAQETAGSGTGDLSDLIKKINESRQQDLQSATTHSPEKVPLGTESHLQSTSQPMSPEAAPDTVPLSKDGTKGNSTTGSVKELSVQDVRDSMGKIMAEIGSPEPVPGEKPSPSPPPVEFDIFDEPEKILQPPRAQPDTTPPAGKVAGAMGTAPKTESDEKIISVDQISDLSGLILPKGATFKIEELKLHGRVNVFEGKGTGSLPPEINEIWQREFSSSGFKDIDFEGDVISEKPSGITPFKKFGLSSLFKGIKSDQEQYNAKIHGPLVDLAFQPKPGLEEIEVYPVNEPYAYVRIIYDHATHEYTYMVLEPLLTEPEKDLLKELKERLFETLDINTKDISKDDARNRLRAVTDDIIHDYGLKLSPIQREKIFYNMSKDFIGDGLIDAIMHDKYIEDISCDGVNSVIFAYHASYESMKTTLSYHNAEELDSFVTKLAQRAGKYISIAEPILDATMSDGSRIQMTLGQEVTAHGSTFTIRKFKDEPITPTDLIEWHTFAPLSIAYIWLCVEHGKSAIFAGGTASGKTTSLNAIALFIPPMAKIVSLEDTREIKLPHPNWIPSVTRDSFDAAGRGEINMYELLRAAMRQRPEYIIVGEVRGKECQTLFQAMSTGHTTYSTTHADSVSSVVHRFENPPMDVPRNMLSALDFICIQVQARVGGKRIRRNKQIVEILDIDPRTNELITNEVFKWRSATDEINYSGKSYLLEEIMEAKGWSENRMREELKRRQEVLEWMRIKKIRHYKDVAKILISYHRDPEAVIEKVRKDLYE
ncbi:MAG: type II/IV secretion system ATPase subunit [Methanoregula sp.]|nr:MAG: type II/IV secretion system ATPase subunit [Methanoregula sp.]